MGPTTTAAYTCRQADVDQWLTEGKPMRREARTFVHWARDHGQAADLTIPSRVSKTSAVPISDDHRWELARRLLHDTAVPTAHRVTGLLVLLYGQPVSQIARLTTDQVSHRDGTTCLTIGEIPIHLPEPLGSLVTELAQSRAATADEATTRWLFPGRFPHRPINPTVLMSHLRKTLGVRVIDSRTAALIDLAGQLPTGLLCRLLGISEYSASRWRQLSPSPAYAAVLARRT